MLYGSAHALPWLSIGAEGAWAKGAYSWTLIGPEPLARNPFHAFGVVRLHALFSRRVEGSLGVTFGLTGERRLYLENVILLVALQLRPRRGGIRAATRPLVPLSVSASPL